MKKIIAILCVAMLLIATAVPAMADQGRSPGGQSAGMSDNRGGGRGGKGNQTPPDKPSGDNSSANPGKSGKPGNAPMNQPGGTGSEQSAAAPADKPESAPSAENGNKPGERKNPLQKLLDDGKLSQATYDAIQSYMKANASASGDTQTAPEKPEGEPSSDASDKTPPEKPEGEPAADASGKNPPEKPEGNPNGDPSLPGKETLDAMLSEGLITEDEYNLLLEAIAKPTASSENTDSASTGETDTEETGTGDTAA